MITLLHLSSGFDCSNDQAVTLWYQRRTSKHLLMRQPAKPMDLVKVVQYDQKQASALSLPFAIDCVIKKCDGEKGPLEFRRNDFCKINLIKIYILSSGAYK